MDATSPLGIGFFRCPSCAYVTGFLRLIYHYPDGTTITNMARRLAALPREGAALRARRQPLFPPSSVACLQCHHACDPATGLSIVWTTP
jgi:hypothetical protein